MDRVWKQLYKQGTGSAAWELEKVAEKEYKNWAIEPNPREFHQKRLEA
jgi:hypothetical protein